MNTSDDAKSQVLRRDHDRWIVLAAVHTATDGEVDSPVGPEEVFATTGMRDADRFNSALEYVIRHGLVERPADDYIALTHAGLLEYESKVRNPSAPTKNFESPITVNVGSIGSIGALVNGDGNTTTVTQSTADVADIIAKLDALAVEIQKLDATDRQHAHEVLSETRAEVKEGTSSALVKAEFGMKLLEKYPQLAASLYLIKEMIKAKIKQHWP